MAPRRRRRRRRLRCSGGGASCCGAGASGCGAGASGSGAGASGCGAGASGSGAGASCLWWGCHRLSWCGTTAVLFRGGGAATGGGVGLCRRRRDLWRRRRRNLPYGGWPDQCGEHRAVRARLRPLRSQPRRHWNCAAPTTLAAVLIKAAITATVRPGSAIRLTAHAIVFDAATRLLGRRAAPLIWGFARKPSGDSRATSSYDIHHCRRQTAPLLPLGVDSKSDVEQVTPKRWKSCRVHQHH